MPVVISVRETPTIPLEVDTVRLETLREQSPDDIRRTLVQQGNRQVELGDYCDVSGSASDDNELIWQGDCSRIKLIGTHLAEGTIRVEGDAGMHLGAEMTGGEILVTGNTADWTGAEMHGGRIRVLGNAGHLVGSVYRGGLKGMTGGEILIHGNAGNELGHSIRRGLIAVAGRSGDAPGVAMLAGTILLFGEAGIRPGPGMKRGTIVFFQPEHVPDMLPTFREATTYQPVFLRICLKHLQQQGFPVPEELFNADYQRYSGDLLESGKGEILIRQAESPAAV